jgi:hypothetical protein
MAKEIVVVGVEDDGEEICFVKGVLLSRDCSLPLTPKLVTVTMIQYIEQPSYHAI